MTAITQTEAQKELNIDWENLGFSYIKTDYRFISYWKDGKWDDGELTTDNKVHISEGSPALHYGHLFRRNESIPHQGRQHQSVPS